MFLLRRSAVRAITSTPSIAVVVRSRSIATIAPGTFRSRHQQCILPFLQRRLASDEAAKKDTVVDTPDNFAQTAAEAPVEENLTPAATAKGTNTVQSGPSITKVGKSQVQPREPIAPNKTLYVGNLFYEVTADQLKRIFARFGDVENIRIVNDHRGLSKGFAYVDFKNLNDAQAAVENLDMQVFEGRNLVVQFHRLPENYKSDRPSDRRSNKTEDNPPSKTLFIGNMSFEMSDKDLNDLFRDIRNVIDVRVAIDRRTGQPRGFAHAEFIDVASAAQGKEDLAGKTLYGRQLRVNFAKSANQQSSEGARSAS